MVVAEPTMPLVLLLGLILGIGDVGKNNHAQSHMYCLILCQNL